MPDKKYDLVVRRGNVVDGLGNPAFEADVAVLNGRIAAIGKIDAMGKVEIDAKGKVVCPGFISLHEHADTNYLIDNSGDNMLRQGVTTEVHGNCGFSAFPWSEQVARALASDPALSMAFAFAGSSLMDESQRSWTDLSGLFAALKRKGLPLNYATMVGHANLRYYVMGETKIEPDEQDMAAMANLVREAMRQGALGLSAGLQYMPGCFATTDEIVALAAVAARYGGYYATHQRDYSVKFLQAIEESLEISRRSGAPLQLSHYEAAGKPVWGTAAVGLQMLRDAIAAGMDVASETVPHRVAGQAAALVLPVWVKEGGPTAVKQRLAQVGQDPELYSRLVQEIDAFCIGSTEDGWNSPTFLHMARHENLKYKGKTVAEAAQMAGKPPANLYVDLLIEGEECWTVTKVISEENMVLQFKEPYMSIVSDAATARGVWPRFLAGFVKEKKIMSLEEGIKRCTSVPARRVCKDRGVLKPGFWADIVVMDYDKIDTEARLKYELWDGPGPFPKGFDQVIVNGKLTINQGENLRPLAGQVIYGPGYGIA
ncbi:MAG: N-acyl-D-amino-acid deacylase family protein [Chloroflexota bacterium]